MRQTSSQQDESEQFLEPTSEQQCGQDETHRKTRMTFGRE
jgi:hypothetical protein